VPQIRHEPILKENREYVNKKNSLGQTASDFAAQFPNIKSQNMSRLLEDAIKRWKKLLAEYEI
jgi:hypothetical protein